MSLWNWNAEKIENMDLVDIPLNSNPETRAENKVNEVCKSDDEYMFDFEMIKELPNEEVPELLPDFPRYIIDGHSVFIKKDVDKYFNVVLPSVNKTCNKEYLSSLNSKCIGLDYVKWKEQDYETSSVVYIANVATTKDTNGLICYWLPDVKKEFLFGVIGQMSGDNYVGAHYLNNLQTLDINFNLWKNSGFKTRTGFDLFCNGLTKTITNAVSEEPIETNFSVKNVTEYYGNNGIQNELVQATEIGIQITEIQTKEYIVDFERYIILGIEMYYISDIEREFNTKINIRYNSGFYYENSGDCNSKTYKYYITRNGIMNSIDDFNDDSRKNVNKWIKYGFKTKGTNRRVEEEIGWGLREVREIEPVKLKRPKKSDSESEKPMKKDRKEKDTSVKSVTECIGYSEFELNKCTKKEFDTWIYNEKEYYKKDDIVKEFENIFVTKPITWIYNIEYFSKENIQYLQGKYRHFPHQFPKFFDWANNGYKTRSIQQIPSITEFCFKDSNKTDFDNKSTQSIQEDIRNKRQTTNNIVDQIQTDLQEMSLNDESPIVPFDTWTNDGKEYFKMSDIEKEGFYNLFNIKSIESCIRYVYSSKNSFIPFIDKQAFMKVSSKFLDKDKALIKLRKWSESDFKTVESSEILVKNDYIAQFTCFKLNSKLYYYNDDIQETFKITNNLGELKIVELNVPGYEKYKFVEKDCLESFKNSSNVSMYKEFCSWCESGFKCIREIDLTNRTILEFKAYTGETINVYGSSSNPYFKLENIQQVYANGIYEPSLNKSTYTTDDMMLYAFYSKNIDIYNDINKFLKTLQDLPKVICANNF